MILPHHRWFLVALIYFVLSLNLVSNQIFSSRRWISSLAGRADQVHYLPDENVWKHDFNRHYSGYLKSYNQTYIHYWFFEAQYFHFNNCPVVLWLSSCPGCSSLIEAMAGVGPLTLTPNRTIVKNPFSWNLDANLLFLESPVNVGFSYQLDPPPDEWLHESTTAQLNFEALRSFYKKFPHLIKNDLYLAGQSYAGIHISTLSMLILKHNFPVNFKGISLGNALFDKETVQGKCNMKQECANSSCKNDFDHVINWFNRDDVQKAMKISHPNKTKIEWKPCIRYQNASIYNQNVKNIRNMVHDLLENNIKVLLYYGDLDLQSNYVGAEGFIDDLNLSDTSVASKLTPYYYKNLTIEYLKQFPEGLMYVRMLKAGHGVLSYKPELMLKIFREFVEIKLSKTSTSLIEISVSTNSSSGSSDGEGQNILVGIANKFFNLSFGLSKKIWFWGYIGLWFCISMISFICNLIY